MHRKAILSQRRESSTVHSGLIECRKFLLQVLHSCFWALYPRSGKVKFPSVCKVKARLGRKASLGGWKKVFAKKHTMLGLRKMWMQNRWRRRVDKWGLQKLISGFCWFSINQQINFWFLDYKLTPDTMIKVLTVRIPRNSSAQGEIWTLMSFRSPVFEIHQLLLVHYLVMRPGLSDQGNSIC